MLEFLFFGSVFQYNFDPEEIEVSNIFVMKTAMKNLQKLMRCE
jgi:hypothetical protein